VFPGSKAETRFVTGVGRLPRGRPSVVRRTENTVFTRRSIINSEEFKDRVVKLCIEPRTQTMPSSSRDRHILLKSVVLTLDPHAEMTVEALGAALDRWLRLVGHSLDVDLTALRRMLVVERYLELREKKFRVVDGAGPRDGQFSEAVDRLDVFDVALHGVCDVEQRRRDRFPKPGREEGKTLIKARMVARWLVEGEIQTRMACWILAQCYDEECPFLDDLSAFAKAPFLIAEDDKLAKKLAAEFLAASDEWVRWL
jgi:hypothetical protein